jgi:hypothetical protein
MRFRDRFYTPTTAKAILSWRIALGVGVGVAAALVGLAIPWAVVLGALVYAGSVALAMPRGAQQEPSIDPFTLSEPWRQLMQGAQGAGRKFRETVAAVPRGPLREQLDSIGEQLQHGLADAWRVAKAGDDIDHVVRRLDPPALRSKLSTAERRAADDPSAENQAAVASLRGQLETADRLKQQSADTAAKLRLTQTQLDELVARAGEVRIGASDSDSYARDVDDLVLKLEALRLAVEETRTA